MKINEKNLSIFAKTPPYDMEGFLNKRGEVNKAFQRRYFVLKGNLLFYFESRHEKEPQGLIIVEGCTIELSQESEHYCFEIAFSGNRTYILSADSQECMEQWMKALTCAGYEYKRIIVAELQRQLREIEEARNKMRSERRNAPILETDASGRPIPPPRRNPFNPVEPSTQPRRAAPPPPAPGVRGGVVMSPITFMPGYFGSSSAKAQLEQKVLDNGNSSPQTTPKSGRRHGPTVFYDDLRQPRVPAQSTVLASNNNPSVDLIEEQYRLRKVAEDFRVRHEEYRKDVMKYITEYRAHRQQPLIQF